MRTLLCLWMLVLVHLANAQQYVQTHLTPGLDMGVAFDFAPDGRIFATKKGISSPTTPLPAQIRVYDMNGTAQGVFCDLSDSTFSSGESGLLGIAADPNFAQNHFVYCYYVYSSDPLNFGDAHLRVQRFTESSGTGTQPTIILDIDVADTIPGLHVGGNIHFRPSDSTHIYVTIGDMFTGQSGSDAAARLDNPLGKILRISKYPNAAPPADNPFYDDGNPLTGNNDYIWAYGLRNSFDFCFGPNDSLYATENGTGYADEINLITRGGFYGWPYCEGTADGDTLSLPCHATNSIAPLITFGSPLPALTGIVFYTSSVWSEKQNHLLVTDYNHADITDVYVSNAPAYNVSDSSVFWIDGSNLNGITCMKQGPDGCIYIMQLGDTSFGGIYKICPLNMPDSLYTWSLNLIGPNPFNTSTTIRFGTEQASNVNLSLYDTRGRLVETLVNEYRAAGQYQVEIDAQKMSLTSGVYICRMETGVYSASMKLVVE